MAVAIQDDTGMHRSAPVDTEAAIASDQGTPAITTDATEAPLIFGSLRSPKEHAMMVLECIRAVGLEDRSVYQGEIEDMHAQLCERHGWIPRRWPAVGRELAKLPGVRKGKVWVYGRRLTVYELAPGTDVASNVVSRAKLERKRA